MAACYPRVRRDANRTPLSRVVLGMDRRAALAAFAAVLALTGCGSDRAGASADPAVQVSGTLRMTGGPAGATQPGAPGDVLFTSTGARQVTHAAADGAFSISLPPGTYTVAGTSPQYGDGQGICRVDAPVVVTEKAVSGLVVACSRR
jgi:hypothetical protein